MLGRWAPTAAPVGAQLPTLGVAILRHTCLTVSHLESMHWKAKYGDARKMDTTMSVKLTYRSMYGVLQGQHVYGTSYGSIGANITCGVRCSSHAVDLPSATHQPHAPVLGGVTVGCCSYPRLQVPTTKGPYRTPPVVPQVPQYLDALRRT